VAAVQAGDVEGKAALLRRTVRSIKLSDAETFEAHAERTCLSHDAPGFLYFDGGSYSYSDFNIGAPLAHCQGKLLCFYRNPVK
jgi:hypothetical protein